MSDNQAKMRLKDFVEPGRTCAKALGQDETKQIGTGRDNDRSLNAMWKRRENLQRFQNPNNINLF